MSYLVANPKDWFSCVAADLVLLLSGTNLQALIDFTRDPMNFSAAEIVLVISNRQDALGLKRAENAGIATKVGIHSNLDRLS